jgi:lysophospholipase L1-like esterase
MTSAYAITDYYFFAPSYLTPSVSPATTKENVEEWVRKEHERINAEIMERYGKEKTETGGKDIYRILFIGTSQTWGAGARTKQECFVNLLENKLNRELNSTYTFECINAGISGSNSTRLLEYYGKHWLALQPKLVIINLSANDWNDPDQFYRNLNQFVLISKAHNIKTIFSLEAIPLEAYGEPALSEPNFLLKRTLSNHNTMIRCAQENNIFVLNLHGYLRKKYDDGILWWDCAHLRPFGHRLTASYIFDNIKDFIR